MQKTILYIVLLAAFGFGVWYLLFNSSSNAFGSGEAGFTVKDTGAIAKIFLNSNNGGSVTLERSEGGWKVNRQYTAQGSKVYMLLQTIYNQQAQFPVPENMHNNVIRSLAGSGIKVELYDRQDRKMRTFYVGSETNKFTGTFMLLEGAKKPYIVQIPGFEGYLTPRYNTDVKDWRDRTVFNIAPEAIKEVSVRYDMEPLNSFTVARTAGQATVALADPGLMEGKQLNRRRTDAYLKFFQNLNCEQYLNGIEELDSTVKSVPKRCSVDVTGNNGYHQHADVYYFPMNRRSKNMLAPRTTDTASHFDSDRSFAIINGGKDTVVIQNQIFDKVFRRGYEFYMPDPPAAAAEQQRMQTK